MGRSSPVPRDPYRPVRILAGAALVATALSISLTQIAMALTVLACLFQYLRHGPGIDKDHIRSFFRERDGLFWIFVSAAGLFAWLGLVGAFHLGMSGPPSEKPGELMDGALFAYGVLLYVLARSAPPEEGVLRRSLEIMIWVLLLSGIAACFSEFRPGRLVSGHGFEASAANRPQHPVLLPGEITLFRPVGFMNTRLTYAGLLILVLPILWGDTLQRLIRMLSGGGFDRSLIVRMFQTGCGLGLLYVNGTRSALLGAAVGLGFASLLLIEYLPRRVPAPVMKVSVLVVGVLLLALGSWGFVHGKHQIAELDFGRHTDFQRAVIWNGSGEIAARHPLLGVGPGDFRAATLTWRAEYLRARPHTLYWIYLTPSGHAHNDLLHLTVVGGGLAGLLFLGLALSCVLAGRTGDTARRWFFLGTSGFFVAGLFQCYFQDDEVATLFWMLIAILGAARSGSKTDGETTPVTRT